MCKVTYRIVPSTAAQTHRLLRRDVALMWRAGNTVTEQPSSLDQSRAALEHLRRILLTDDATAALAETIPESTDRTEWVLTLAANQPVSEIAHWRQRLLGGDHLYGHTADPPFSGWIGVHAN
jgi:hypothetical protein